MRNSFPSYARGLWWQRIALAAGLLLALVLGPFVGPASAATITSISPEEGSSDNPAGVDVTVTFAEPMDPATINGSTFVLRDASAAPVSAVVSYDAATQTATLDPDANLAQGATYTATVQGGPGGVLDLNGIGLEADRTWSFGIADTTAPTVELVEPADGAEVGQSMTVSANASDNVADGLRVEFSVDDELRRTVAAAPYVANLDMEIYPHGSSHTVAAQAVDGAGNRSALSQATVTVDREVNLVLGDTPQQGSSVNTARAALAFTTDADVPASGRECRLKQGAEILRPYEPCVSPYKPLLGADGIFTYEIRVTDDAGNAISRQRTFTRDTVPPTLRIDSGPNGQAFALGTTQTWTFSAADATTGPPTLECSIRTAGAAPNYGPCSDAASHSVTDRPEGTHEFKVRATDGAGNSRVETRRFSIDANLSAVRITSGLADGASTRRANATWEFRAEAGATFECRVYRKDQGPRPFGSCSDAGPDAGAHTATQLTPGAYVFEVRGFDAQGVPFDGPTARRDFTVDVQSPRVVGITPRNGVSNVAPSANVTATFSEGMDPGTINRTTFKLTRAGKTVAARVTYAPAARRAILNPTRPLQRGQTYRAVVAVGARDAAGNPLAASRIWTFRVR